MATRSTLLIAFLAATAAPQALLAQAEYC